LFEWDRKSDYGREEFNVADHTRKNSLKGMKLEEIEKEAIALTEHERIDLVCRLLDTLPPAGTDVSDE
jgi:hypothetical protein